MSVIVAGDGPDKTSPQLHSSMPNRGGKNMSMHKGSGNYLIGTLIAKPLLLYSIGGSINTGLQLFLVYVGIFGGDPITAERMPELVRGMIFTVLPILPPIGPVDVVNFILNVFFGALLAVWWTVKWSHGMSG